MKKDLNWKVTVDGQVHEVRCETFKTVYDVYVDGDLALRMGRNESDGLDTERDIRVGGKVCQFVIYDGTPDLSVDGVLQGAERSLRRAELRNRILLVLGGLFAAGVSTFAAFLWFVFDAAGERIFGGYLSLAFIAIFAMGGLVMVFFGLKPKKRY